MKLLKIRYLELLQHRFDFCTSSLKSWIEPTGYDTNIKIFNSITKTKVPLILKRKGVATWYTCGPTVYDSSHIGHASCFVKQDILQRILRDHFGVNVITAMNVTDIDDKIINRSLEAKEDWMLLARRYEDEFWNDMERLGIEAPNIKVRVSDHMPQIIQFIEKLLEKKMAYTYSDGSVYFDVSKFPRYGKFQNVNIDSMEHEFKRSSLDFAVWKGVKLHEPFWNSPWGKGRPGWHIECSVLATILFGDNLDFHGGGLDLRFPHHENEEAQCCVHHNVDQWVNYWIHTGQLHIAGQADKMSKSLKNTLSISELLSSYTSDEFRMLCLLHHYRSHIDFGTTSMENAKSIIKKIHSFRQDLSACVKGQKLFTHFDSGELYTKMNETSNLIEFSLRDDFNTNRCIEHLLILIGDVNKLINERVAALQPNHSSNIIALQAVNNFVDFELGIFGININDSSKAYDKNSVNIENILDSVVEIRNKLRKSAIEVKDKQLFQHCDHIRDVLKMNGISIKDHGQLSSWRFAE